MQHRDRILRRLRSAEGHVGGVIRMVEKGQYCIDIIRQIQAVQAALGKISTQILESHLDSCVATAIRGDDPGERERVLREITEVFGMSTRAQDASSTSTARILAAAGGPPDPAKGAQS
jgi:DNA-binding FrmR family transcriptional regulator